MARRDLAAGWLCVAGAKTYAGIRRVKIRGALRDELGALKARTSARPDALGFPTSTGADLPVQRPKPCAGEDMNRANLRLGDTGEAPLPAGLIPHSLRRTFASLRYAIGEPAPVVAGVGAHTPGLALGIYAAAMRRDDDETGTCGR